jgi:hypothetical protein
MTVPAPTVSAALADALAGGRPQFNARVAETRHRCPAFDTTVFTAFLRTGLDSVARSVAAVAPDRTAAAVAAAYDIALELVAQGLAGRGARSAIVEQTWTTVAPRCAHLVAVQPVEALGALSNAGLYVAGAAGARPRDWLNDMAQVVGSAQSLEQLRLLGQVAAWRAGLAQFRDGALQSAQALPVPLALMALGVNAGTGADDWPRVRDAYRDDPWWSEQSDRREAARKGVEVGQFIGLGGSFAQPPQVLATQQGFAVRSADRFHLLMADAYGAVLLPSSAGEFEQAQAQVRRPTATLVGTQLLAAGRCIELDLPEHGLALAENDHTIALTSAYSHAIRVYPRS